VFLKPTPLTIESPDAPAVVLDRLRRVGAEWRESVVNAHTPRFHILRWRFRESETGIEFAPTGREHPPVFRGKVVDTPAGSVIRGEIWVWDPVTRFAWVIAPIVSWLVVAAVTAVVLLASTDTRWRWAGMLAAGAILLADGALERGVRRIANDARQELSFALAETLREAARGSHPGA